MKTKTQLTVIGIIAILLSGFAVWKYIATAQELSQTKVTAAQNETRLAELQTTLDQTVQENSNLHEELDDERERNDDFERQIRKLTGTVGTLEKLSQTDKELLQKYSKVSFLNEHYVPKKLSYIDTEFIFSSTQKKLQVLSSIRPFLENMLEDAKDDGVDILVVSAYRSFGDQTSLKASYRVTYGSGANTFSADQGYSEHQLGTTLDFTTPTLGTGFEAFEGTPAFTWLTKNAYKYGFVLSYPKGNTYYQYEPWHWRFVGESLARQLNRQNKYFYDLDQRDIDEHLVDIFD